MRNDKWIAFAHNLRYSDSVRQSDVRSSTDDGSTQVKAAFRVHRGADKERNIPSAKAHTLTRNLSQHAGIALQRSIHKNPDCPVRKWSTGTGQRRLAGRGLKPLSYLVICLCARSPVHIRRLCGVGKGRFSVSILTAQHIGQWKTVLQRRWIM